MRLNDITDNPGSSKKRMRIGRGIGSGKGKTGGRGGKGQTARSGVRIKGFEGGQMPLHRRLPKRGFTNIFKTDYNEVNLGRIQQAIEAGKLDAGQPVTIDTLIAEGLAQRLDNGRYAHAVQMLAIAQSHANEMAKASERIQEINQRVAAQARF